MKQYYFNHKTYLSTAEIEELYHLVIDQGLEDILFYDRGITSVEDWMSFTSQEAWLVQVKDGAGGPSPVAMFWLTGFMGRSAQIHFCTFKAAGDDRLRVGLTSMEWLRRTGVLDSVYGCTPEPYRHAIKFIKKIGFELRGTLPGACHLAKYDKHVPGVVSVLDLSKIKGE
ncbi:MAG: hypothetical protein GY809_30490 [Planctomycetes bacterium]|nr:hypothetical protein [Planctomycetota bacterium]